jgi:site-specific DNA recombinase
VLLIAIARARSWMNDLTEGRVNLFEAIAGSENKVERHIRRLMPLAFVSPRIVKAIANGSAPADLTVTSLTSALSRSWTKQEKRYGIVCPIARRGHEMTCTSGHVALVIVVLEL